ncbi:MAG: 50S ribosomal protein L35 [Desulfomicrobium sp.]|nr:50S ribosomal protein L35 [Desulfomicrobium sp.]NLV97346.1 50S ribosomal protein L35 [Desulfovibrionales bacterium]
MPKLKTNRSAAKRFTVTGTGKVRRNHCNMRHILTKKSPKRKRQLRQSAIVHASSVGAIRRMVPYIF